MKKIIVNRMAIISKGTLKGFNGNVVAFDADIDEVKIQLDLETIIVISSDNIEQEILYVQKRCECGCSYDVKETENDGKNYCNFCGKYY